MLGQEKKLSGSGQLIFENWSGGPVALFSFFLNHNINIPNLIVQKVLKLEIQIKPVLKTFSRCHIYFAAHIFFYLRQNRPAR